MQIDTNVLQRMENKYGLDQDIIAALVQVESNGVEKWQVTFAGKTADMPVIRFEGHYFYKRLSGEKLKAAIAQGLAAKGVGAVKNPKSAQGRYSLLMRAIKIDREAALESISMGVGQVMGANWKMLGYTSASNMFQSVCSNPTIEYQIDAMCRYIVAIPKLKAAVKRKDVKTIALYYNGKLYAKYGYDKKLAAALANHHAPVSEPVKDDWLDDIHELGYDSVNAFQHEHGLVPDGKIGPATISAIKSERASRDANTNAGKRQATSIFKKLSTISVASVTAAVGYATELRESVQPTLDTVAGWLGDNGVAIIGTASIVIAVGAVGYYIFFKEPEKDS